MSSKPLQSLADILASDTPPSETTTISEEQESTARPARGTKQDALAKKVWVGAAKRGNAKFDENPAPSKKSKTADSKGKKSSKKSTNEAMPSNNAKGRAKVSQEKGMSLKRTDASQAEMTAPQTRTRAGRSTIVRDPVAHDDIQEDADSGDDTGNYNPENDDISDQDEDIDDSQSISADDLLEEQVQLVGKGKRASKKSAVMRADDLQSDDDESEAIPFIAPTVSRRSSTYSTNSSGFNDGFPPETDAGTSDASSAFNMSINDEDESDSEEVNKITKPTVQDTKYNSEVRVHTISQLIKLNPLERPVLQASKTTTNKVSKQNTQRATEPSNSHTSAAQISSHPASADPRNNGWDYTTFMTYPASGKRYIKKENQPPTLAKVMKESISIAIGLFLFRNAFPTPEEAHTMVDLSLTTACTKLKQPHVLNRIQQEEEYRDFLIAYIMGRVSSMRGDVKKIAVAVVPGLYEFAKLLPNDRAALVKGLVDRQAYIFPLNNPMQPSSWRLNEPYRHPAIVEVIKQSFFQGPKSYGKQYDVNFMSSSETDKAKEIPTAMLALASVAVFAALREWLSGERTGEDFSGSLMTDEYQYLVDICSKRIIGANGRGREKYHNMTARLYREVNR
ncbi:hypothetical protein K435DRAFT_877594 [Dendrothele bispora CBS 962.96]|uniref:DUF6532 domain-containing protein n=1 Tax=Dendrothele bispora (strain CBS 962.96) TaxID=1314807 RepID=A0A4S8KPN8_DENBC|nr:hypothetical protein K435DRAFT_877594 [Dendrothele bispora CBS 962.96]